MKLPNKINSFKDSTLHVFVPILEEIENNNPTVRLLYEHTKHLFSTVQDFIDVLDCLYFLGKITYIEDGEVIRLC